MSRTHVIIHGHFYQPPRENPWTDEIDRQPSAFPYHDWNERINVECYSANARSRIQEKVGWLTDVINNYRHISFNFGPTLFSWLEKHDADTYRRIIEADRQSLEDRGCGNAMAQAYNHVILPLASARDRWTQIRWGLEDFRLRFGRSAEGLWLPETATNEDTLADLVRAGMKFVILSPAQVEAWREPGGEWRPGPPPTDRVFYIDTSAGRIAAFFYHAGLSAGVAFEHLLRNASILADRIEQAGRESSISGDRLVMICSDGESYGHHEKLADMCLAYLASREAPRRGFVLTNPAAFLRDHPPRCEVRLKKGQDGRGTSWSCAHGVERWRSNCGCADGGPREWNQAWRTPMRAAFDALRQEIDPLFENLGARCLRDPWAARDDYVQVLVGRPLGLVQAFFTRHLKDPTDHQHAAQAMRLLEMQRLGMYMYTSCGWFFADIGGLEAVQNIRYAVRAAELASAEAGRVVGNEMYRLLAQARSNQQHVGTGLDIIERHIRPAALAPEKAAALLALEALLSKNTAPTRLGRYRVVQHYLRLNKIPKGSSLTARFEVRAEKTAEGGVYDVLALVGSTPQMRAFVKPAGSDPPSAKNPPMANEGRITAALEAMGEAYGRVFNLSDFSPEVRSRLVSYRLALVEKKLARSFSALWQQQSRLLKSLAELQIALPPALSSAVSHAIMGEMEESLEAALERADLSRTAELARLAEALQLHLDLSSMGKRVQEALRDKIFLLAELPDEKTAVQVLDLLNAARRMHLQLDEAALQVQLASTLRRIESTLTVRNQQSRQPFLKLAEALRVELNSP